MPNPARSRERSGKARRSGRSGLLLVPALLTALLGPLLPTGTALAATPPPPAASAAPAPDPDPTTPAPEPSTTTDPAPAPTPTVEPSPDPTEPAVDPCPALPVAPLGDPGDAIAHVTLAPQESACFTVTVEKPGLHDILRDGEPNISSTLYSGADRVACDTTIYPRITCDLAGGTYTLRLTNHAWAGKLGISVVPLMVGPECPRIAGTSYDATPATGRVATPLGVVCHAFDAVPGERITTTFRLPTYSSSNQYVHWITDDTGKRICPQWNEDGSEGCVLPPGTGGYRLLAEVKSAGTGFPTTYSLALRRLSNPAGCAPVSVGSYGVAPAQVSPPTGCRSFTPTTSGRYDIRGTTASGRVSPVVVYTGDGGKLVCDEGSNCGLTAGITYALLSDDTVQVLSRSATDGCANDITLASVHRGTIGAVGEVDCQYLALPQGAKVSVLRDEAVRVEVRDARGVELCDDWDLGEGFCTLSGTAPYRLLADGRYSETTTGDYHLIVHRTDAPSTCRTFLAGDFTADSAVMAVRTGEGVFADCLTIPADDHSAREIVRNQRVAGDAAAQVTIFDPQGKRVCAAGPGYDDGVTCNLAPGLAHTVLVQGSDSPAEYALTRMDVTATARGCVPTPATAPGGPSTGGVPAAPGGFRCHQVTTADAGDVLHLNARDSEHTARLGVFAADGSTVCDYSTTACAATGSTRYQAIVMVGNGEPAAPSYHLDALRFATAAGPAPECVKVPSISYGFGPLSGTLSEQKSAICAVLPTATGDRFDLAFTPEVAYDQLPGTWLYDGSDLSSACAKTGWSAYDCSVTDTGSKVSRPTTLVIGLPEQPDQDSTAVRAQATCTVQVCGLEKQTIGTFGPATVGAGKITMTLTGTLLRATDRVEVYREDPYDAFRAESTTVSVAPDLRSMTVALDLTYAPSGPLHVTVFTHYGQKIRLPDIVVGLAIRSTALPSITGTAVVGGKVTATTGSWTPAAESYAYQWRANGVAIAGATASTYTLPSTLFGKQLSVAVTARKAGHPVVTATSPAVLVKGVAPKPTTVPRVSGTVRVGSKVTAVVGTWTPAPTSYAYQWRANGVAIAGATGASYVPVASTLGKKLTVTVTALRTGHLSGAYTTAGVTVAIGLAPKATTAPYVTGTVRVGRTLTLNRGAWTPAPTSYAYQWYANGRAISGATRTTFTLTSAQRGLTITVRVTAYRTGHAAGVAWTRSTGAVAG
ncbi:hypothetical protein [Streptomyces vietnamensis]|uniref:hypothetical protein n=1 Tax=Streptomyces vietnamensis TaxID=362257 RepID=UPI003412BE2E